MRGDSSEQESGSEDGETLHQPPPAGVDTFSWPTHHDEENRQVQYSTVQYSTVQYSTEHSTVQYSTVQYSTVQYTFSWPTHHDEENRQVGTKMTGIS